MLLHAGERFESTVTRGAIANALLCEDRGTVLVSPVGGNAAPATKDQPRPCDFFVDPTVLAQQSICPAGHTATRDERNEERGTIRAYFDAATCNQCERRKACPARRLKDGTRVLYTTDEKAHLELRRTYEKAEEFKERYAARAGIEATNAELKRRHGLGRLRVRRQPRVRLVVYLKAAACNVKRMVTHFVATLQAAARNRLRVESSTVAALMSLMATQRRSRRCRARLTTPMAPRPSGCCSSYLSVSDGGKGESVLIDSQGIS